MKKRILYIAFTIIISLAAFFLGRETKETEMITVEKRVIPLEYIDVADIVDWNSNGEEMAIFTKDGYEFYAYKSENIYGGLDNE